MQKQKKTITDHITGHFKKHPTDLLVHFLQVKKKKLDCVFAYTFYDISP